MSWKSPHRITIILTTLFCMLWALNLPAGIDDSFDWKNNKRNLKIKIADDNAKLGDDTIKSIMQAAIDNWNNITPATGWTLSLAGPGETGDIDVEVGKITDSSGNQEESGGAYVEGGSGKDCTKMKMKFDPKPKEGWQWGKTGAKKLDPIAVAKHELGHCMRLKHEGGVDTGNLGDPITPGNHVRTPSTQDAKHVRKAATIPKKKATATTTPVAAAAVSLLEWSHCEDEFNEYPYLELPGMETFLMWPEETFLNEVEIEMTLAREVNVPDIWSMPNQYERFVRGMWVVMPDTALVTPALVDVQIPYFDNMEDMDPCMPEELLDLADPQYGGQVEEPALYVVLWNPMTETWDDIMPQVFGFMMDPELNHVNFQIPADLLTQYPDTEGDFVTCLGIGGPFPFPDCNENGQHDGDDIDLGLGFDCNENWILDECDIASGFSDDFDGDGVPDECMAAAGLQKPRFRLHSIAPNPFNPITTITYELFADQYVKLGIYTLRGELVQVLVDEHQGAGLFQEVWRGMDNGGHEVASGVYLMRLETDRGRTTRKLALSR